MLKNNNTIKKTALNRNKALLYKTECIESLIEGKLYKNTADMVQDSVNW